MFGVPSNDWVDDDVPNCCDEESERIFVFKLRMGQSHRANMQAIWLRAQIEHLESLIMNGLKIFFSNLAGYLVMWCYEFHITIHRHTFHALCAKLQPLLDVEFSKVEEAQ